MWPSAPSSSSSPYAAMEDVWREISTLPHHHPSAAHGVILQDFLSNGPPQPASPTPPPTVLTLNSLALRHQPVPASSPAAEFEMSVDERRHKRMIKNRESAARSRARKQAYTNELELEVAHLLKENAKLKEQQQQLYRAAAAQHPKGNKPHHRTFSAPF